MSAAGWSASRTSCACWWPCGMRCFGGRSGCQGRTANHDLFYGKDGDLTGSDKESQEVSMLALHLLQSALVHVNTLLLQDILSKEKWRERLTDADRRALSPPFWTHVNPYGRFEPDMNSHLDLAAAVAGPRTAPEAETARSAPASGAS
ncbi:Tn3 family transposase [Streptosporangium sp. NPDC004379]|uniref:Tn3 family transposase n=1 Tax=Streptosporangium sp. NPDC004379 TaxID=3366189 RepID=UPI0036D07BB5